MTGDDSGLAARSAAVVSVTTVVVVDADAVVAAVAACPSVAALSGGVVGEVATYLPGRRVVGVRVRDGGALPPEVDVHVVGRYGPTVAEIAAEVRAAVGRLAPGIPVSVSVDDLADPGPVPPAAGHRAATAALPPADLEVAGAPHETHRRGAQP